MAYLTQQKRESELKDLARAFVFPLSFSPEMFEPVLQSRFEEVKKRYHDTFEKHEIAVDRFSGNPRALFRLTHSSYEYILYLLANEPGNEAYLLPALNSLLDRIYVKNSIYSIHKGLSQFNLFPDSECHKKMEGYEAKPYEEFVEASIDLILDWNKLLRDEIGWFVPDFALSWEASEDLISESVDHQPGHIKLFPKHFLDHENATYEKGSDIEKVLMAAQIVHEGRHQKTFFFNRISTDDLNFRTCGFIKQEFWRGALPKPLQDYCFVDLFDVSLSVGYEYLFLNHALKSFDLGEYQQAIEEKCERKKKYLMAGVMAGETSQDVLTPLGLQSWKQMLTLFKEDL